MLYSILGRPVVLASRNYCTNTTIKPLGTYWFLKYTYVDNALEKRAPIRASHIAHVTKYTENNGPLILGGAFNNPLDGAAIVFKNVSREVVEEFARNDPYVINGLVKSGPGGWEIREWTVVVGSLAK